MSKLWWGLVLALTLIALAACDAIRYPNDGRGREYQPETPPGAPGPAPPSEPVTDPYGDSDADEPETPSPEASDPDEEIETPTPPSETESDLDTAEPVDPSDDTDDVDANPENTDAVEPETPDSDVPELDTTEPDSPDTEGRAEDDTETSPETDGPVDTETPEENGTTDVADNTGTDVTEPETPEEPEPAVVFSFVEPGQLVSGSGTGTSDPETIFSPDMRFPIKSAPAFLQSQVWGFGGGIKGGDQCDARNYEYPWRDNFCETRSSTRNSPYCPVSRIHQGQDIRVGTAQGCNDLRRTASAERALYEVVAVEDGIIQSIGTYTVTQRSGPRVYKYMHMNMRALQVSAGDTVTKGQKLGYVSNDFGGTPTTFHLHFEMLQNTADSGWVHVPPYTSLVSAYERRESGIGEKITANIGVASAPPPAEIPADQAIDESFVVIDESME